MKKQNTRVYSYDCNVYPTKLDIMFDINEIDYTKQSHIGLPAFFVDDKATDVENFKNKNNITSDLNSWLENNTEYLQKHKVTYKCLVFTFTNGVITNIQKSEKDFNK